MPVIVPIYGTELGRSSTTAFRRTGEIHTTTQASGRLFIKDVCVSPKYLGIVADEAAMLALDSDDTKGCFPGDECKRTDTGTFWRCISNRGGLLADWVELGGTPPTPDAADIDYDNTTSGLTATDVQAALDELAAGAGGGGSSDMRDMWLFG